MEMRKKIRQVTGTSIGITFTKEERDAHGLEVGDIIDMSDAYKIEDNHFMGGLE